MLQFLKTILSWCCLNLGWDCVVYLNAIVTAANNAEFNGVNHDCSHEKLWLLWNSLDIKWLTLCLKLQINIYNINKRGHWRQLLANWRQLLANSVALHTVLVKQSKLLTSWWRKANTEQIKVNAECLSACVGLPLKKKQLAKLWNH